MFKVSEAAHKYILNKGGQVKISVENGGSPRSCRD